MLKRDMCDKLYAIAIKRIQEENPKVNLTNDYMTAVWNSIYGVLNKDGEEAAKKYVETAKISKELFHK